MATYSFDDNLRDNRRAAPRFGVDNALADKAMPPYVSQGQVRLATQRLNTARGTPAQDGPINTEQITRVAPVPPPQAVAGPATKSEAAPRNLARFNTIPDPMAAPVSATPQAANGQLGLMDLVRGARNTIGGWFPEGSAGRQLLGVGAPAGTSTNTPLPGNQWGTNDRGVGADVWAPSAASTGVQSVAVPPAVQRIAVQPADLGPRGSDLNPSPWKQQYDALVAKQEQDRQSNWEAQQNQLGFVAKNAALQGERDRTRMLADFASRNAGAKYGTTGALGALRAQAQASDALKAWAENAGAGIKPVNRNAIAEAATLGEMQNRGLATTVAAQRQARLTPYEEGQAKLGIAEGNAGLEGHAIRNRYLAAMDSAKTPEEYQRARESYLATLGKYEPTKAISVEGAQYTKPGEYFPTKEAGYAVVIDSAGAPHIVQAPQQAIAGQMKPATKEEAHAAAKAAIANGAPKDVINERLKGWGYPTL